MSSKFTWPDGFLWGAATAAHQVEGNNVNNWSVYELAHAAERAKTAEARYHDFAIWHDIAQVATSPDNYVSGLAADHYRRYREDFALAEQLGLNAFRFSVEWSRLEPRDGHWDTAAFAHYRLYIRELRARGLEPVMTLYHWTHPLWFDQKGAFTKRANQRYFLRFVDKLAREFGQEVRYVCTVNEPDTVMMQGYVEGNHAPGMHSPLTGLRTYLHLLSAHKQAYRVWKRHNPTAIVGLTKTFSYLDQANAALSTRLAVRLDYLLRDDLIMWYLKHHLDFVGVQFYFTDRYDGFRVTESSLPKNDLNWPMQPENLAPVLMRLGRHHIPLLVTETGVADMHDRYRRHWLQLTIMSCQQAIESGVTVLGYLHWSFLDNFEWAEGRWPRFGLIAVDYEHNRTRQIRPSAKYYAEIICHATESQWK